MKMAHQCSRESTALHSDYYNTTKKKRLRLTKGGWRAELRERLCASSVRSLKHAVTAPCNRAPSPRRSIDTAEMPMAQRFLDSAVVDSNRAQWLPREPARMPRPPGGAPAGDFPR